MRRQSSAIQRLQEQVAVQAQRITQLEGDMARLEVMLSFPQREGRIAEERYPLHDEVLSDRLEKSDLERLNPLPRDRGFDILLMAYLLGDERTEP